LNVYPPNALLHLKVTVSHDLDINVQLSRLLAVCSTLTHLTIAEYTRRSGAAIIGPGDLTKLEWLEGPVWYLEPIIRGGLRPVHTYCHQRWVRGPPHMEDELVEGIRLLASSENAIQELEVYIFEGDSERFEAEARALRALVP
jgi:hypothetical protein